MSSSCLMICDAPTPAKFIKRYGAVSVDWTAFLNQPQPRVVKKSGPVPKMTSIIPENVNVFYRTEGESPNQRQIAVAYVYDHEAKQAHFASCTFREDAEDFGKEPIRFHRKTHRYTALKRLCFKPRVANIELQMIPVKSEEEDDLFLTVKDIEDSISAVVRDAHLAQGLCQMLRAAALPKPSNKPRPKFHPNWRRLEEEIRQAMREKCDPPAKVSPAKILCGAPEFDSPISSTALGHLLNMKE